MTQYNTFYVPVEDGGEAQANVRRHGWFLKCDFRKYFDSIPHDGLRALLARKFKDGRVLHWFGRILWMFAQGRLSESEYQGRVTALTAFVAHFDSVGLRRRVLGVRREASGSNRVQRGGSWNNDADNCASSNRNNDNPSNRNNNNGFRLACPAAPQEHATVPADVLFPSFGRDECAQCSPPPVGGAEGRGLPFSISGETHCGRPERPRAGGDRCE